MRGPETRLEGQDNKVPRALSPQCWADAGPHEAPSKLDDAARRESRIKIAARHTNREGRRGVRSSGRGRARRIRGPALEAMGIWEVWGEQGEECQRVARACTPYCPLVRLQRGSGSQLIVPHPAHDWAAVRRPAWRIIIKLRPEQKKGREIRIKLKPKKQERKEKGHQKTKKTSREERLACSTNTRYINLWPPPSSSSSFSLTPFHE